LIFLVTAFVPLGVELIRFTEQLLAMFKCDLPAPIFFHFTFNSCFILPF